MAVTTQANSSVVADHVLVENTYFNKKCVTFGDIHSVSSNNGYLDPNYASTAAAGSSGFTPETASEEAARYAEVDARIAPDVRWIDAIFSAADANSSGAVVLMMQAEPTYGGVAHPNIARLENWGSNTGGVLAVTRWQKVTATSPPRPSHT